MSAAAQEIFALMIVVLIAGIALRSWWRSRQRRAPAACGGCPKGRSSKSAEEPDVVNISLHRVRSEIKRSRR